LITEIHLKEIILNFKTRHPLQTLFLVPMAALGLAVAPAQAQTAPAMAPSASMPMGQIHKGAAGPHDMKASMMMGMDSMQKMSMSGDTDKDFAMMMKMHHQQALNMAEMELAHGKSAEMKAMAKQIIVAQKKEIAQFDRWLATQK
jgi:uncharacterized protein (DUF305 family)